MKTDLSKRLISLRESTGLSSLDFSKEIGMPASSYQYYEGGYKKDHLPSVVIKKLFAVADKLGMAVKDIEGLGRVSLMETTSPKAESLFPAADLPILGKVMGGVGMFFDNGQKLGDTMRPTSLIGIRDAYAVYIDGTSMEPRYYAGELAMVHPHKPYRRSDFVVVQYDDEQGERCYTIKRFVKRNGDNLHLEQLNPISDWVLPLDRIHFVHRVIGAVES